MAPQYESVWDFIDGFTSVKKKGLWGFIDGGGAELVVPQYESVWFFSEGFARVRKGGLWGLIDANGAEVAPPISNRIQTVGQNYRLLVANGKKGVLFLTEKTYIPPEYDDVELPREEEAWVIVRRDTKWGWVDKKGDLMIPIRYDAVTPFDENDRAWVYQYGLQFQINRKGEMIWR